MPLSPTQKKILYVGVPVVAVLGLIALLRSRSRSSTAAAAPAPAAATGTTTSSNSPIGLDQLTSFESQVTAQLGNLGQAVAAVQQAQTSQPPAPATSTGYYPSPNPIPSAPPQTIAPPTSSGTTAPTPLPAPSNPFSHIDTAAAGSVIAASGATVYGEPQPGVYVPVIQNGQWTDAGQAYRNEAGNPGLFTTAGT